MNQFISNIFSMSILMYRNKRKAVSLILRLINCILSNSRARLRLTRPHILDLDITLFFPSQGTTSAVTNYISNSSAWFMYVQVYVHVYVCPADADADADAAVVDFFVRVSDSVTG